MSESDRKIASLERQRKTAWKHYYVMVDMYMDLVKSLEEKTEKLKSLLEERPDSQSQFVKEFFEMAEQLKKSHECCVCFEIIHRGNIFLPVCGHMLCSSCSKKIADKKCPQCRKSFF